MPDSATNYTLSDYNSIADDWSNLEQQNRSYFQSQSWQATWQKLAGKHDYQINALKIENDKKIQLLSSFGIGQIRVLKIFNQAAIFLNATGKIDYDVICTENCQPLMCEQASSDSLSNFLNYLVVELRAKHVFINAVPLSFVDLLKQACKNCGLHLIEKKRSSHFWLDLENLRQNKLNHLQVVTQRTRGQIRKNIEAYKNKFGDLAIRYASCSQEAKDWLKCLIELNIASLNRKNLTSSFKFPFLLEFHLELIDCAFSKNEIVMARFDAGENTIGYIYGFCYKKTIYIYQTGFNFDEDKKLSPGMLAHHLLIEDSQARDLLVYDFLAGDYQYKKSLSNQEDQLVWIQIINPNVLFSLEQSLRNFKRKLLRSNKDLKTI